MKIELPYKYSYVSLNTNYNGDLEISFKDDKEVYKAILESIYEKMNTDDFIETLDYDQIEEISEYFETIKDKK